MTQDREMASAEDADRALSRVAPELRGILEALPVFELDDEVLADLRESGGFAPISEIPADMREAIERVDRSVPGIGNNPPVRVLTYTPRAAAPPRPAYLHIHGGGFVFGSADMSDVANRKLALELDCVVVSVDYRLAPETRFPGALDDCHAALAWLVAHAADLGVDGARIALGGESAGGGHAASLALRAATRDDLPICFQFLDSPMLDDRSGSSAARGPYNGRFLWTPTSNRYGWRALLGVEPGSDDVPVEAVPARMASVENCPPTLIVVGALDLFLEENLEYARRLIRAGVQTELHVIPGAYHGYSLAGDQVPQAMALARYRHDALARAFGR